MQAEHPEKYQEVLNSIRWVAKNPRNWEDITECSEMNAEELLETLKSLVHGEAHVLFLALIQMSAHTEPLDMVLSNVIWNFIANTMDTETIIGLENTIVEELENALLGDNNLADQLDLGIGPLDF